MIQEYRNVIGNKIVLVITKKRTKKEDNDDSRIRNAIGNEIILVITRKATTK